MTMGILSSRNTGRNGLPRGRMALRPLVLSLLAAAVLAVACASAGSTTATDGSTGASPSAAASTPPDSLLIRVSMATTKRGNVVPVDNSFYLRLLGDSVSSNLPYFGRAYSAPIGTESVLRFDATMSDFTSTRNKDGATRMEFRVRTIEDTFRFRVEVYDNGRTTIYVRPTRREAISFDGDVDGGGAR